MLLSIISSMEDVHPQRRRFDHCSWGVQHTMPRALFFSALICNGAEKLLVSPRREGPAPYYSVPRKSPLCAPKLLIKHKTFFPSRELRKHPPPFPSRYIHTPRARTSSCSSSYCILQHIQIGLTPQNKTRPRMGMGMGPRAARGATDDG